MTKLKRHTIFLLILGLMILFLLFLAARLLGVVSASPRFTAIMDAGILAIPAFCVVLFILRYHLRHKRFVMIGLAFLALISLCGCSLWLILYGVMNNQVLSQDHDPNFELLKTQTFGTDIIRVYRTNGGATTDYGVVVREETEFFPGLLYTKVIDSKYHASNAIVSKKPNGDFTIEYNGN